MTVFQAVVLGAVQGVTEFFPVSSSGHLVLVPSLLHWPVQDVSFDAAIHLATLFAVVLALREDVSRTVREAFSDTAHGRLARAIGIATLPALFVGFLISEVLELDLRTPAIVAFSTGFWAIVMLIADRSPSRVDAPEKAGFRRVLAMGFAQVISLVPGTSRSGITLTAGRFMGLTREAAIRLSFLLGIPVIAVSGALAVLQIARGRANVELVPLAVGFVVAFLTGWASIRFLLRFLKTGRLWPFAVYRIALAIVVLRLVV